MRGKIVNFFMALLNLMVGAMILVYVMKIPKEITELTVQEYHIISILIIITYIVLGIITLLNIINYFLNSRDTLRKTGYLLAIFSIAFIFIKELPIAVFSFLGSLIIMVATLRERWIETNSITIISIIGILGVACCLIIGTCFIYKNLGVYILNKENENELAYTQDFFQYITELDIKESYISVRKDNLYGYITPDGNLVIDYQFDYASPFVKINVYDKNFEVALVCKEGSTWIIMKNLRKVLTYRSESMDGDYASKEKELQNVYYNILKQTEPMEYEINQEVNNRYKVAVYKEEVSSYTYRYDYNEEYDVIVTKSSLGFGDTYELAHKGNIDLRVKLDCEKLCYDENYLYILSNGTIPFYDLENNKQGWFTKYGNKVTLKGNAQILEVVGDYILINNHNDNTIYFIDSEGNAVSDVYKEAFICGDDRYIVKNKNNKYMVINSEFKKVFESEWDFVDTSLLSVGLYVFGTTGEAINFNDYNYSENMNLSIVNADGKVVAENIQQVYNKYYVISSDKKIAYSKRYSDFLNSLKVLDYTFVGDEFYE